MPERPICPVYRVPYPTGRPWSMLPCGVFGGMYLVVTTLWARPFSVLWAVSLVAFFALSLLGAEIIRRHIWKRWRREHPIDPGSIAREFERQLAERRENAWMN